MQWSEDHETPVFRAQRLDWNLARELAEEFGLPDVLSNFGPIHHQLENEIATFLGVEAANVVVFSSATTAISAALNSILEVDEIVLPDFSFIGTLRAAQTVRHTSLVVRDVDLESWSLIPEPSGNGAQSSCYLPVDPFGSNPQKSIKNFTGKTTVFDFAASIGSSLGIGAPEQQHAYCYSLHATKVLGSGEGGFAVFGSKDWAERARDISNFGKGQTEPSFGTNGKMSEVQAAFALSKFRGVDKEFAEWKRLREKADEITEEVGIAAAPSVTGKVNPYWIVRTSSAEITRDLESALRKQGCQSRRWWPQSLAALGGQTPGSNSELLRGCTLGLPFFPKMSDREFSAVQSGLKNVKLKHGSL